MAAPLCAGCRHPLRGPPCTPCFNTTKMTRPYRARVFLEHGYPGFHSRQSPLVSPWADEGRRFAAQSKGAGERAEMAEGWGEGLCSRSDQRLARQASPRLPPHLTPCQQSPALRAERPLPAPPLLLRHCPLPIPHSPLPSIPSLCLGASVVAFRLPFVSSCLCGWLCPLPIPHSPPTPPPPATPQPVARIAEHEHLLLRGCQALLQALPA